MNAIAAYGPQISGYARKVPTWPVYLLGTIPAIWAIWLALTGGLGFDPVRALEHKFGLQAFQFLLASLTITPILRFTRINLLKFRKALGLLAFGYLCLHFLTWLFLDLQLQWQMIGAEIVKRPYLTIGFAGFVTLVPLAATSWQGAVRRLGPQAWARLHRLVYVAVLLGGVHFIMQEKVWTQESLLYLGAAAFLVALRLLWIRRW